MFPNIPLPGDSPLIWLELAVTGLCGMVVGWITHALLRRKAPKTNEDSAVSSEPVRPARDRREVPGPVEPEDVTRATVSLEPSEPAATAGRVISHLFSLGRLGREEIATVGHTQKGMTDTLHVRQGTLAKVLSRLEAAGVLETDRRHVSGQPRRLKVYYLTGLGESVARDLRHKVPQYTLRGESSPHRLEFDGGSMR